MSFEFTESACAASSLRAGDCGHPGLNSQCNTPVDRVQRKPAPRDFPRQNGAFEGRVDESAGGLFWSVYGGGLL